MQRNMKIILGVFTSIIIIAGSTVVVILLINNDNNNGNHTINNDPPVMEFPIENVDVLMKIDAFIWDNISGFIHDGIDFGINDTATIIASCNMTVNDKGLFYNDIGGHWQAGASFTINDDYELFVAFESFAQNETFGNIQLDAITVEIGQEITKGDILGQLFYHEPGAHIHFMLHKKNVPVCPYQYFSPEAKAIFDTLWTQIGSSSYPCNGTICY
ncbi:MAG: M23 family metallopeptidase [Asgard group archaeon]|nr:M23 family metallopeptidase [Asgard group archaeon]